MCAVIQKNQQGRIPGLNFQSIVLKVGLAIGPLFQTFGEVAAVSESQPGPNFYHLFSSFHKTASPDIC